MASQKIASDFIVRKKNASYLWVIDPSTKDTDYVDRTGFKIDTKFECRGKILRIMKIDGIKCCIGRLAIGQRVAIKNSDGTPCLKDGQQKFTYQPSTYYTWGSIHYFPPSQPVQLISGHIDLRDYFADDGSLTGKDLYELIGDIVQCYNQSKHELSSLCDDLSLRIPSSVPLQAHPVKLFQPTPLFTAQDYHAWQQFQAFLQWQHHQ
jgi:hypothetical protein